MDVKRNRTNSFWKWFMGGIGTIVGVFREDLYAFFKKMYLHWDRIFVVLGFIAILYSLLEGYIVYTTPVWRWVGDDYCRVDPTIGFWMISKLVISLIMFMVGLYGHWRKEVRF